MPHAHILLWLGEKDKLDSISSIDSVISAELPDPTLYPKLYSAVTGFMVHGPCGFARPNSPCMKDRRCSKFFPKKFVSRTSFDEGGYPIYRRRDLGIVAMKKDIRLDNRSVVPYNPTLVMKYQAHVNIEFCNKSNCIKYLFKYITKGVDRVTATVEAVGQGDVDEIQQYYDCRYLSPCESIWRIFAFDIHSRYPPVQRLTFHLNGKQRVIFDDDADLEDVVAFNQERNTMFLAWMDSNKESEIGRSLTYPQYPSMFVFNDRNRTWQPRQRGISVGRLTFVPPSNRELYYLRLLLNVQVGCTSFEDIHTVDGVVFETYQEAYGALGLLADDRQFIIGINEVAADSSGGSVRKIFANLLMCSSLADPFRAWEMTWEALADGILYHRQRILNLPGWCMEKCHCPDLIYNLFIVLCLYLLFAFIDISILIILVDLIISDEDLKELCLVEIDKLLRLNGKTLDDYESMSKLSSVVSKVFDSVLLANELAYDQNEMLTMHGHYFSNLNEGQLSSYDQIVHSVENNSGGMFFVYGYGGTGKTYLWNALSFRFRSEGKIVINVASSGIASLLLPGGRTAHSQFAIPLVLVEDSCCLIEKNGKKAQLLTMASLIIWDEAPMINRLAFEAFDRTMRDVMNNFIDGALDLPFGGKTIVFGGDFRQILLVVPKGSRADVVHSTINSSPLWSCCKVLRLTQNMRLQGLGDAHETQMLREFAAWILNIGDGKAGDIGDGEAVVEIPNDLLVENSGDPIGDIVRATYPDLIENMADHQYFRDRAVLAPTLDLVEKVNDYVMGLIPGDEKEYLSADSVCKCDDDIGLDHRWITTEFLNDIKCSGMPNHRLILKIGVPVMLLWNVDQASGLCNGTCFDCCLSCKKCDMCKGDWWQPQR